jgi:hypothetical protein
MYVQPKKMTFLNISLRNPSSSWAFLISIVASNASAVLAIPNAGVRNANAGSELQWSRSVSNMLMLPDSLVIANATTRTSVGTAIKAAIVTLTISCIFIMTKFASIFFSDVSDDRDVRRPL